MKRKPNCAPGGTLSKNQAGELLCDTGGLLWWDTRRDPLASYSGGILGGIHWRASYSGILSGLLGGIHWRAFSGRIGELLRRDTRWDRAGKLLWDAQRVILGGIHWQAALAGYSAGSTGEPLWRDTRRDPLASRSGGILGGIHWPAALLASRSGGILGGIHWRAALAGYSAGSTGEPLWRDTWRDPLASRSGGILGGIHW